MPTHLPACPDPRCPAQHPPRFPPALPCPARATDEKKESGWRLSVCPAPQRGGIVGTHSLAGGLQEGWKGTQFHKTPSLQVGRCGLKPKQLLSPSAVSLCHGRGHLPSLKSPYQALQGKFTPLTSPWARSWHGGHQTITRVLPLGFEILPRALRAYSQACSLSPQLQSLRGRFLLPQHPLSLGEDTQVEYSCTPITSTPWGNAPGCHLPAPPAPQSLGDRIQVLCSCSLSTSMFWNRHPAALPPSCRHLHPFFQGNLNFPAQDAAGGSVFAYAKLPGELRQRPLVHCPALMSPDHSNWG